MNRKIKVMHLVLTGRGGTEVYDKMLIHSTLDNNDIVYICPTNFDKSDFNENVTIYELDVPREITFKDDIKAVFNLKKIIKKERPDILYCHSSMAGALGRLAAIGNHCKVIYNPHGWSFDMTDCSNKKRKFYILIERFLAKFTDKIITISEHEKQIAVNEKICAAEKIKVILNGVDLKGLDEKGMSKEELGFAEDNFVIGCIARMTEQKDPLLFADVAGEISKIDPDARFVWVGDGELRQDFEERLKQNNVFDKTLITGWVSSPKLYSYSFDVSVLFSKWEGFGLVVPETLAQGKPVVATSVGGISEIIGDFNIGCTVKERDPLKLAKATVSLKNCDEEIAARCKNRAKDFDFSVTAEKTLKVYDEVIL